MKCYCCNEIVTAVIMWQSKPHDDGRVSIRIPLCLACSERGDRSTFRDANKALTK